MEIERASIFEKPKYRERHHNLTEVNMEAKTEVKKVKALELIMDWNLWPRYEARELSLPHIKRMRETLEAGGTLPPIIIDRKSNRIIDGFHRTRSHLDFFGDGAEIMAEVRDFKNEAEMVLESARINCQHGLPLSSQDRVHVILKLRKMKSPWPVIAEALGMDKDKMRKFFEARIGMTKNGENIPLPAPVVVTLNRKMNNEERTTAEERVLTREEKKFARSSGGVLPIVHARLLMNALRASACPLADHEVEVLKELADLIREALKGYKKAA